jgi:type II secretory pathway pseudopilin PulG
LSRLLQKILESIRDQAWFQSLKGKWDELDAQSRTYLQGAFAVGSALLVTWLVFGTWWKVRGVRRELTEKQEILQMVRSAAEEMRSLQEQIPTQSRNIEEKPQPWDEYFQGLASNAGVASTTLEISGESPGQSRELSKEGFIEIQLKKVNVKQLSRFSFQLENGRRPVKIRKLQVDTHTDLSGYLDAKFSVAVYTLKAAS